MAVSRAKGIVARFLDFQPGEGRRALLMAANLFLIIGSFYILKPVRSSVFLVSFGPEQLPYVFMLIALIGGVIATVYSRFAPRVRLGRLIVVSSLLTVALLLLFRLLLGLDQGWVSYAFYIVVSLYGVMTTSQFWLLANNVFDSREARRLFGFIGAGGIVGSIVGSAIASTLTRIMPVEDLILIAAAMLGLSVLLTGRAWALGAPGVGAGGRGVSGARGDAASRSGRGRQEGGGGLAETIRLLRGSRYLTLLTGIIGLTVISGTLVDYILSAEAFDHFSTRIRNEQVEIADQGVGGSAAEVEATIDGLVKNELTTFFGRFYGLLSVLSLVLQLALVGRILGSLGVGWANIFLPLGLLWASGGVLVVPGLLAAAIIRLVDGSLSYSLGKAGTELLFIPLPLAIKNRTKTFIDLFTDRLARGVAGVLLLVLTSVLALGTRGVAVALVLVLLVWLVLLQRMHGYNWRALLRRDVEGAKAGGGEYLAAFGRAIAGRTLDVEGIREMVRSPEAIRILADSLHGDERQVVYTLTLLESADSDLLVPHLIPLLTHESADVRRLAMRKLADSRDSEHRDQVTPLIDDPERAVRREAARYLARSAPEGEEAYLRALLAAPDGRSRGAAVEVIARHVPEHRDWIDGPILDSMCAVEGPDRSDARVVTARAIAALGPGTPHASRLEDLLEDPDLLVRVTAMEAAGEVQDPRHLERLLSGLGRPGEHRPARAALASYGDSLIPVLGAVLDDDTADIHVREQIPRTIGLMHSQSAVDFLLKEMHHPLVLLRYQVVKALGKIRARDRNEGDRLRFDSRAVEEGILAEVRGFSELKTTLEILGGDAADGVSDGGASRPPGQRLLRRAIAERIDQNLERIFRLLGLRYPAENMLFAYNGVVNDDRTSRANAIEFLDNLLSGRLRQTVMPLVTGATPEAPGQERAESPPIEGRKRDDYLRAMLAGKDRWLVVCAIDAVRELGVAGFEREIAVHRASPTPLVRETALLALGASG